jgi:hypothetical protein
MAKQMVSVETRPYTLHLNQIKKMEVNSGASKKVLNKITGNLKKTGFNSVLPIACLTDNEDEFVLLTGLPIYEAAKSAGLKEIWVFLVAAEKAKASKWVKQNQMLSKFNKPIRSNEKVINSQDISAFLKFVNKKTSDLTSVVGIGPKIAQKICDNGPYNSLEELQSKLGQKRPLNWIRAFKQL